MAVTPHAMSGDPDLAARLRAQLRLPVIAGPMFIASTPAQVIAQCKAGIAGSLPALNPRSTAALDEGICEIEEALRAHDAAHPARRAAPYAVNIVAHKSNSRLEGDLDVVLAHRVPITIISLAASSEIVSAVHAYGGLIFSDIVTDRHARKCADIGVDGLVAVASGAGGHTGRLSPFALVQEIRRWWRGPLALSGCIATGQSILGACAMGADFAYIGSPFLVCDEANTSQHQKSMIVESDSNDVIVTDCFTGVPATFLRPSIAQNGLDPTRLVRDTAQAINIDGGGANAKAWRDIWSAGQGIGAITKAMPTAEFIDQLASEYAAAKAAFRAYLQAG